MGAARAGMLVAKDTDDDERRVLACTKSNLGPEPDALSYRLVGADAFGVARVQWEGPSTHDARALLADHRDGEDRPERDGAAAWLEDYLTEHSKAPSKDVKLAARREQITDRTLQRAAQQLRVQYVQEGSRGPRTGSYRSVAPAVARLPPVSQTVARLAPLERLGLTCRDTAPVTPPKRGRASRATLVRRGATAQFAGRDYGPINLRN